MLYVIFVLDPLVILYYFFVHTPANVGAKKSWPSFSSFRSG